MRIAYSLRAISSLFICSAMLVTAEARLAPGAFPHASLLSPSAIDDNSGNSKGGKDDKDKNDKSADKTSKDGPSGPAEGPDEEKKKPAQKQEKVLPAGATIIVGDRALAGPFSSPQMRGSRIFLPVASVARSLGDQVAVNPVARAVEVRRQTGVVAEFNARLKQVLEDGAVILVVSDTADIVFPPNPDELMLPVEIISPLLDVSIIVDEGARAVRVIRRSKQSGSARPGAKHAAWEVYQIDYAYNLNLYPNAYYHNFSINSNGRIYDGRYTLVSSFDGGAGQGTAVFRRGTFTFDAPGGRRLIGGDFGTGTDLTYMATSVRGVWAQQPVNNMRVTAFAGRSISGLIETIADPITGLPIEPLGRRELPYDTSVIGSYATFGPSVNNPAGQTFLLYSSGLMYFTGPSSSGAMATAGVKYTSERNRFQGDIAAGNFSGATLEGRQASGFAPVIDITEVFNLTKSFTLQGRVARISPNFLSPQSSGVFNPMNHVSGGFNWRPSRWLSASLTGSSTEMLDDRSQDNRSVTATVSIVPDGWLPTILLTHTESVHTPGGSSSYTLMNATRDFKRWRLFGNFTRIRNFFAAAANAAFLQHPPSLNASAGARVRINDDHSIQASQSVGSGDSIGGDYDWMTSRFFSKRISLGAGFGYSHTPSSFTTTWRLVSAAELPWRQTLQVSYMHTPVGPQMLFQLRGLLFVNRKADGVAAVPLAEIGSLGAFYGRVYQDINLNGRFDPGLDRPQADVQIRVDGNYYAETDRDGLFRIDNVKAGEHTVYLDLLTVRADLTLLDSAQQAATLRPGRDSIVDFRLVRTGRIRGVVWLDGDGNGKLDPDEQPLADVRIVTASGRDTLTSPDGEFIIGDLPPGEHVLLIDEKTLPDNTRSASPSVQVLVKAGAETGNVHMPVINSPSNVNVKRFPSNQP